MGPHNAGVSLMGGHEDHRNSADSVNILPPPQSKIPDFTDPTRGVPRPISPKYRAGSGILSRTNAGHFDAFGTGVTGQGEYP